MRSVIVWILAGTAAGFGVRCDFRDFLEKVRFEVDALYCQGLRRLDDEVRISTELALRVWFLERLGLELSDMMAEIVRFFGNLIIWLAESLSEEELASSLI